MPNVDDKRQEGIALVQKARNFGTYTRVSASASLIDILINEGMYDEALIIANESLQQYPHSQVFMLGKARALFGLGNYKESETVYRQILTEIAAEPGGNKGAAVQCHFGIAKIGFVCERYDECVSECDLMKNGGLDDDVKKLLEKSFSEADGMKKKAITAAKGKRQSTIAAHNR
jgi:tetratricopeptide (TPR) repeat protein